ncbi:hypothetical protein H9S71_13555 [Staphylococcus aureus]|uniref:hypothetical protein n=1 Tax=Staphylococcus TaxID=1279 RepID=UPI00112213D9|nr:MULTISPECIES: hypothetical protein [Staphylococcus]MBW5882093.1 hypothetical protein [Staphylococcus aureus]TOZ68277.1 hypothetical protein DJ442_12365 [Staphylococcus pseudintermedius]
MSSYMLYKNGDLYKISSSNDVNNYKHFYELLECELIEVHTLSSNIKIVVDEEARLYDFDKVNLIYNKENGVYFEFFSPILFVKVEDYKFCPLNTKDLKYIKENVYLDMIKKETYYALKNKT